MSETHGDEGEARPDPRDRQPAEGGREEIDEQLEQEGAETSGEQDDAD